MNEEDVERRNMFNFITALLDLEASPGRSISSDEELSHLT
jgi:hypothetical protein